jgi:hypothetical protein
MGMNEVFVSAIWVVTHTFFKKIAGPFQIGGYIF